VVLHVSESFGGGVVTAMLSFASNAPWAEHHLLAGEREGAEIPLPPGHPFRSITGLPQGSRAAIRAIRRAYRQIEPDIVHLHSSFAGAYGRLAGLPRRKIIYTPHCFGFENTKRSVAYRAGIYLAEQALSIGGGRFAGVSPRECALARGMVGASESILLPNFARIPETLASAGGLPSDAPSRLRGAMVGRMLPQKDPEFFIRTWRALRPETSCIELTWIGGGEGGIESEMRDLGIEVTGWIGPTEVLSLLRTMDFYVHTAAWEGNPMSVLEAAALKLPIVARDIPALRSIGMSALASTPEELAALAASLAEPGVMAGLQDQTARINRTYSRQAQVEALRRLYGAEDADGGAESDAER
jgi:glycosyltransferase involved in cell wall biosynthesis